MDDKMINICLIGFNVSMHRALTVAVANRAKDICMLTELGDADIALVDIDDLQNESEWREPWEKHEFKMVAVSSRKDVHKTCKNEFCASLSKPLQFTRMLTVISNAAHQGLEEIEKIKTGGQAGAQVSDQSKGHLSKVLRSEVLIDSDYYLLGRVRSEFKSKSASQVSLLQLFDGKVWLAIDRVNKTVFLNIRERKLMSLAILEIKGSGHKHDITSVEMEIKHELISEKHLEKLSKDAVWQCDMEKFIWLLTRLTVRSAGLSELSMNKPYRLRQWPDLTRYSTSEKDLPLSSYWVGCTSTIEDLAQKMDLSIDSILPFASCCLTAGYLVEEEQEEIEIIPEPVKKKRFKNIFSQILGRLAA
ncbi:MAG: hypothetical protein KAJ95_04745 [Gammaproteobacteria bacterium]|nr:hypothetical protein [Gammaproteobacteria bacterium]